MAIPVWRTEGTRVRSPLVENKTRREQQAHESPGCAVAEDQSSSETSSQRPATGKERGVGREEREEWRPSLPFECALSFLTRTSHTRA